MRHIKRRNITPENAARLQRERYTELLDIARRTAPTVLHRRPLGLPPSCCKGAPLPPTFRLDYHNKKHVPVAKGVACRESVTSLRGE